MLVWAHPAKSKAESVKVIREIMRASHKGKTSGKLALHFGPNVFGVRPFWTPTPSDGFGHDTKSFKQCLKDFLTNANLDYWFSKT
jgi:hypothetical protein